MPFGSLMGASGFFTVLKANLYSLGLGMSSPGCGDPKEGQLSGQELENDFGRMTLTLWPFSSGKQMLKMIT